MAGKVVDIEFRLKDNVSPGLGKIRSALANNASQITRAGSQIRRMGYQMQRVGRSLTQSVTVPLVGVGVASVKLAADFEKGMDTVASISGATGGDLEKLAEKAKEMGKQTKFSAKEATDAYQYMAMAGWKAGEMMDGIEGIMYLAGATNTDLARTSDIVTDSLTAFGKTAADTQKFVDVLAATSNNANTNVEMLGESFKYVGPVAGSMGYSIEDTSLALGLMANSGIKASQAGTSLRTALSRMADPSDKVATAMDQLGVSLKADDGSANTLRGVMDNLRKSMQGVDVATVDADGNLKSYEQIMQDVQKAGGNVTQMEQLRAASTIFGKNAMAGMLSIVNASEEDYNKLAEAIENSDEACKNMYETANDNLAGQLTILKSTVEGLAISIGEQLTPYVSKAATFLQGLAEKFDSLDEKTKANIVKIGMIAAAIGPALLVFGKLTLGVGKVVGVVGKVGSAFRKMKTLLALLNVPGLAVVGVLAALVVAGVLIYKNWDKIKAAGQALFKKLKPIFDMIKKTFDSMKRAIITGVANIRQHFNKAATKIGVTVNIMKKHFKELTSNPTFKKFAALIANIFETKIKNSLSIAEGVFTAVWSAITGVVGAAVDMIGGIINGMLEQFDGLITFINGVFSGNWRQAWEGIKQIFNGTFDTIGAICKGVMNSVVSVINGAINGINRISITIPDWVPEFGGRSFSAHIPTLPKLEVGTPSWVGGMALMNERGGEIVDLPRGARVYPHDESVRRAYNDGRRGGGVSINIPKLADQIIIREDADIDRLTSAITNRLTVAIANVG